jgi:nucleoside-triphosphatase THEP1
VQREVKKNILLTGAPRCGKSTLVEKVINRIDKPLRGFFTRELREGGKRVGFSIVTLDGKKGFLAHQDLGGRYRVGKYGVNLKDIEEIAVPSMMPRDKNEIIVIDEIGKMECLSRRFREALLEVLDSQNPVIGTIALKGDRFVRQIKERNDVVLMEVTEKNRNELVDCPIFYEL